MKVLLLTDMAPCTNHTSGLVINKWCDFLLEENIEIHCALIKNKFIKMDIPDDKREKIKFYIFEKPNEYWVSNAKRFKNIKGKFKSYCENTKSAKKILPVMAEKIANYAKNSKIDVIFASIQGQTMTKLVRKVSKLSKIDYVAQTWDPLEWWMKELKFDPITYRSNLREFGKVVKKSKNFVAMSWAMAKDFEKRYHKKCLINIPSLPIKKFENLEHRLDREFSIAFAGQAYAKEELDLLIETLDDMNWTYKGKEIVLKLYGPYFEEKHYRNPNIEINGFIKQENLIKELKKCNLLYCPYWFSKEYKRACKLSFPGKLTTYLTTGVPVLLHGPRYASPIIFAKINNAGYIINTNQKELFKKELINIIKNYNVQIAKNAWKAFSTYLTDEQAKTNLLVSLNLLDKSKIEDFNKLKEYF